MKQKTLHKKTKIVMQGNWITERAEFPHSTTEKSYRDISSGVTTQRIC